MQDLAEKLRYRIEAEYLRSGNDLGWRFLYSPASVLDGAEIAFVGLNPGGTFRDRENAEFSLPAGSAYEIESWAGYKAGESPLQQQVRALFASLGADPASVLAGNLVPFRSREWQSLANRSAALEFGRSIWGDIIERANPSLVICMGGEVTRQIGACLQIENWQRIPVGWGSVRAYKAERNDRHVVGLPHLSRFGIITRSKCQPALEELFGGRWRRQGAFRYDRLAK